MPVLAIKGGRIPIELWTAEAPESVLSELRDLVKLPWAFHHLAASAGGRVVASSGAVSPGAVELGALGEGAGVARTSLRVQDLPDVGWLSSQLSADIPCARIPGEPSQLCDRAERRDARSMTAELEGMGFAHLVGSAYGELGAIGGGLMGLYADAEERVWLAARTGALGAGYQVQKLHQDIAPTLPHNDYLPRADLSVFFSASNAAAAYLQAASWVQRYAALNRRVVLARMRDAVASITDATVTCDAALHCHYGSVGMETHFDKPVAVSRSRAVRAQRGEQAVLLSSSVGYVIDGLGAQVSFQSAFVDSGVDTQTDLLVVRHELTPLLVLCGR